MTGIIITISIIIFLLLQSKSENVDDFEMAKREFQSGNYSIIINVPKEYYIRPEFYPKYDPNERYSERKAIYGYGAYPSRVTYGADNISAGQNIDVYVMIFSSTGVYTYQGIGLKIDYQNKELFDTHVEPCDIMLSPKYLNNLSNVTSNWSYKIKITIIAKKDIPRGEYIFRLRAGSPSIEKEAEYRNVNGKYINGSPIQPDKLFDITLKVNE